MKVLSNKEREDINKILDKDEIIEREATISWDGSNFSVKLPKELLDYFNVNKENRFEKSILFKLKESPKGVETTFEVIKRTKKRKIRKNDKKTINKK